MNGIWSYPVHRLNKIKYIMYAVSNELSLKNEHENVKTMGKIERIHSPHSSQTICLSYWNLVFEGFVSIKYNVNNHGI